ncbi:TolC family protein [Ancylomarina longa]|uniref:TolC family protein n=1 Tax=Ancylomarina longa TaxID=2487017 RepID=A0A434AYG8_9BACT|nr:TolC family protein [Ancylomarina longa]RUT79608.1 TolC family protein [Ancylomarina longa]
MRNLKLIIGLFFLLISTVLSAQESLDVYLKTAAGNNPDLKAKFDEYMAALEVAPQVKALPDPQVAFAYFINPVETRVGPQQFKISASQMFPWFGTLKAKENAAIQIAKSKYQRFEESKSKLFQEVKADYYNLYFNRKAEIITQDNIVILKTFQRLATIKVEAGLVSLVDEYRIEMELNELENQLALLKDKRRVLQIRFNNLLNVEEMAKVVLPEDLGTDDIAFSREIALDSIKQFNHQLLQLDFQQTALQYKREVAGLMGKPSFKIGLDYTFIGKGEKNLAGKDAFVFPSVGVSIPLYRRKYKAMVKEVVYLEAAKTNEKINKTNLLESLFEKIWKDYLDANRRIDLFERQLKLANNSLSLLETEYATGNKNFEEILRMERKALKFNLEKEKAKTDKQASIAFVTYLMGK